MWLKMRCPLDLAADVIIALFLEYRFVGLGEGEETEESPKASTMNPKRVPQRRSYTKEPR